MNSRKAQDGANPRATLYQLRDDFIRDEPAGLGNAHAVRQEAFRRPPYRDKRPVGKAAPQIFLPAPSGRYAPSCAQTEHYALLARLGFGQQLPGT